MTSNGEGGHNNVIISASAEDIGGWCVGDVEEAVGLTRCCCAIRFTTDVQWMKT